MLGVYVHKRRHMLFAWITHKYTHAHMQIHLENEREWKSIKRYRHKHSNHILWIIAIEKKMKSINCRLCVYAFLVYSCIGDIYIFGLLVVHMTNVTTRKTLIAFISFEVILFLFFHLPVIFSLFCTILCFFCLLLLLVRSVVHSAAKLSLLIISTFCCYYFGHWSAAVCHQSHPKKT